MVMRYGNQRLPHPTCLSDDEYSKRVKANKIIDGFNKVDYDYRNCNFENNSNNEANKLTGDISYETRRHVFKGKYARISFNDEQFGSTTGTQSELHKTTGKSKQAKHSGQEINPLRDISASNDEIKIEKATRDSYAMR